jgi:BASS family bile acid:Na+ symporter
MRSAPTTGSSADPLSCEPTANATSARLKPSLIHKIALVLAGLCFLSVIALALSGHGASTGPLVIGFFATLAVGFRGYDQLKGFTYSTVIFAAVTTALYFPHPFIELNGFKLATLITPLIQVIMFGMGTSMSVGDFVGVARTPKAVAIGVAAQFTIMPCLGYVLANLSGFPPEIAAGIVLIGCAPSGLASNVMSYLANANLALSITITSVTTLLAPLATPLLMKLLGGTFIEISVLKMMWDIVKMVLVPIGGGLLFNKLLHGKARWLDAAMPLVSMLGIALIIVIITAAGRESLLHIGLQLILLVFVHNTFGYFLGYRSARLFKMDEKSCRTIAFEVGMQNGGLASGIAKEMGKIATVGLAPAVFGPLMNITGSILASYWHRKPVTDQPAGHRDQ